MLQDQLLVISHKALRNRLFFILPKIDVIIAVRCN